MLVVGHVLRPADDLAFVGDIGNFHGFHGHFLHELGLHELLGVFLVMLVVFVLMGRMLGNIRDFHGLYRHFLYKFGFYILFGFGFGGLFFLAHGFSVLSYRCAKGMPPERFPPGSCFFYSMREKARQYKYV